MAEWLLGNSHALDRLWFSDEAHFYLCGYVNSRNAMHRELERPDKVLTKLLHSTKVTVWAAMCKGQTLIGPFFFKVLPELLNLNINAFRTHTMIGGLTYYTVYICSRTFFNI